MARHGNSDAQGMFVGALIFLFLGWLCIFSFLFAPIVFIPSIAVVIFLNRRRLAENKRWALILIGFAIVSALIDGDPPEWVKKTLLSKGDGGESHLSISYLFRSPSPLVPATATDLGDGTAIETKKIATKPAEKRPVTESPPSGKAIPLEMALDLEAAIAIGAVESAQRDGSIVIKDLESAKVELTHDERESIESVCYMDKASKGPAAYNQCQVEQLTQLARGVRAPDLTGLTRQERESIESACYMDKASKGPAAYNRCISSHFK